MPKVSVTDNTISQEQLEPLEHATSYEETRSWRTQLPPPPPSAQRRPQASILPRQTSQGSSTRSIQPSSSTHHTSHTSHFTSQPTRPRRQSRGSSTLPPLSSRRPSTENGTARAAAVASRHHPVSEKPRGDSSQQLPQGRAPPKLPSLREEHRYCRRCAIIKPPRTHHCRSCGTVPSSVSFV